MKEEELKQLIQASDFQTSEGFTERLMEEIEAVEAVEAVEAKKELEIGPLLSRSLWLIVGLSLVLSLCFGLYFLKLKPLFILAMGGLMLALNRMLYLKQAYEKLSSMPS